MTDPIHAAAGARPELAAGPIRFRVLATAAETGGAVSLFEEITEAKAGPPLHVHPAADEFFRVLAGRYRFRAGDATIEAGPGDTLFVPRGTPHCFFNPGPGPGRLFMGFAPGGGEGFFPWFAGSGPTPPDDMAAIAAKGAEFDVEFLGPNPFADH